MSNSLGASCARGNDADGASLHIACNAFYGGALSVCGNNPACDVSGDYGDFFCEDVPDDNCGLACEVYPHDRRDDAYAVLWSGFVLSPPPY